MMVRPLERAFDAAAGRPRPACPRCGDRQLPGELLVVLEGDDELSQCPECGRYRGPNGQLLGGNGRDGSFDGRFKATYLCSEEEDEDEELE